MIIKKYTALLVQENGEEFEMNIKGVSVYDASYYVHRRMLKHHMDKCCILKSVYITDEDDQEFSINVKWWYEEWAIKNN